MENKSYWIWHYGEYEIYHYLQIHLRRQEYGMDYPSFWHVASPYVSIEFKKKIECERDGYIIARTTGKGYIKVDGKMHAAGERIEVARGTHSIVSKVFKEGGLPALFIESDVCSSDASWTSNYIKGEDSPVGWLPCFDSADKSPEVFPFEYEHKLPVCTEKIGGGCLYDFGTELFGFLNIKNADKNNTLKVFYGESSSEALDGEKAILFEYVTGSSEYRLRQRAFRYVYIEGATDSVDVSMDYEYLPLERKGGFRCDNELFNRIYDTCVYTFHLNCREAFLDGIKRDRWVWSGDAYQSGRINAYLFADRDIVKRTALGLIGKPPIEQHLNTIVDYSLLWIIGLWEYHMTYADGDFLSRIYFKAVTLMNFCEERINADGFIEGKAADWTFIDWSDIDKTGAVCAEQMLLIAAYCAMAKIADVTGENGKDYSDKAEELKKKVNEYYWNGEKGAFIDSYASGKSNVTRHANIFAIMYDIATPAQVQSIVKNVLKNDAVTKITTPYFEGYELDVLGKIGELGAIENMLDSYWGEMLRAGAGTVWEEFDPTLSGDAHYSMYGDKYGKSLCHAWGAGPVYLFGRYYLGVYPTKPGYEAFNVEPNIGGLKEMEGTVPVNGGKVTVKIKDGRLSVFTDKAGGTLLWKGRSYTLEQGKEIII